MAIKQHIQRWAPTVATFACIAFGTIIWVPIEPDQASVRSPVENSAEDAAMAEIEAALAAGAEELLNRPLFHVTRRPPQEAAAPAPIQPAEVTLSLTGILNSEDVQIALMRLSNSPELFRGRVGDEIGVWRILDITETTVTVLSNDGDLQQLILTQGEP